MSVSGSDWFLPFPTSNVWFLLVWPKNTRHGQTKPVKKSVAVRGGRVKWVSGFVHSHNNTFTLWGWILWKIHKKKLIGYCKPTNFCGRGDRIWTCDLLVPNQTRYQTALHLELWSQWQDLNLWPADYESAALPTELHWQSSVQSIISILAKPCQGLSGFSEGILPGMIYFTKLPSNTSTSSDAGS